MGRGTGFRILKSGFPFIGDVQTGSVLRVIEAGLKVGADRIMLADTIGTASPPQVEALLKLLMPAYGKDFVLHIHDTQGMGLANVLTCLQMGITRYETSVGGAGRLPVRTRCRRQYSQ